MIETLLEAKLKELIPEAVLRVMLENPKAGDILEIKFTLTLK